jgi:hypothetical protein
MLSLPTPHVRQLDTILCNIKSWGEILSALALSETVKPDWGALSDLGKQIQADAEQGLDFLPEVEQ